MRCNTALADLCRLPPRCQPGVGFAGRTVLRFAIVLLGFQLSATQILAIGVGGIAIVGCVVAIIFAAMVGMGSLLGVDARLTALLAAGTPICGGLCGGSNEHGEPGQ